MPPESPLLLRLTVLPKEAPLLVLLRYNISKFPGVLSRQSTYTLLPDTAMADGADSAALLLRLTVLPKEAPLSVLLL